MSLLYTFFVLSSVHAGFLQLTDRQVPLLLDGSSNYANGYASLTGTDS